MARQHASQLAIGSFAIGAALFVGVVVCWMTLQVQRSTEARSGSARAAQVFARVRLVSEERPTPNSGRSAARTGTAQANSDAVEQRMRERRLRMVREQLESRDITDQRVLEAMRRVPRHLFVPESSRDAAYADYPLPIGYGQTISQPYIVALMTQLARPRPTSRALDIGTGSGYQAAVLAELVKEVYSIEILKPLADSARERLKALGYKNVHVRCGDGYRGWPEKAPFDLIIVAAAPDHIPEPLIEQLAPGGRLVIPVGRFFQNLIVVSKDRKGAVRKEAVTPVAFVPMTGEAQRVRE